MLSSGKGGPTWQEKSDHKAVQGIQYHSNPSKKKKKAVQGRLRSMASVYVNLAIEVVTRLDFLEGLLEEKSHDLDLHLWNLGERVVVIYTGKKGNKAKSPRYLCGNISYVGWK